MGRILANDDVLLAKVMKDHLNTWHDKPCEILLEDLGKKKTSMMIQQLSSSEKKRVYVNGSYIGGWNFALYMRIESIDTAARLDAFGTLNAVNKWFSETDDDGALVNLPMIDDYRTATKVEMTSSPSIAARYPDGTEDYQAIFSLEYIYRRT